MKIKSILTTALTAGLLAIGLDTPALAQDKLKDKAKISKTEAKKAALAKVPGGKVKDSELEEEGGQLIWSFDIATKGTKDITEVHVDAMTGQVIKTEKESAADEFAEKAKDRKEKSGKKAGKKEKKEKDDDKDEKK